MPYNLLNKKAWLGELERLTDTYIDFILKLAESKKEIELDIILTKRYSSRGLIFIGQEILDHIQKKLSDNPDYVFVFSVVDNKPLVTVKYRVSFDDQQKGLVGIKDNNNVTVTIEDLKSRYFEATQKIEELRDMLDKREADNLSMFKDLIELMGLYHYVSKKKLILTLSKILKDHNFYDTEIGTQYSYDRLSKRNKEKVIEELFKKIYK